MCLQQQQQIGLPLAQCNKSQPIQTRNQLISFCSILRHWYAWSTSAGKCGNNHAFTPFLLNASGWRVFFLFSGKNPIICRIYWHVCFFVCVCVKICGVSSALDIVNRTKLSPIRQLFFTSLFPQFLGLHELEVGAIFFSTWMKNPLKRDACLLWQHTLKDWTPFTLEVTMADQHCPSQNIRDSPFLPDVLKGDSVLEKGPLSSLTACGYECLYWITRTLQIPIQREIIDPGRRYPNHTCRAWWLRQWIHGILFCSWPEMHAAYFSIVRKRNPEMMRHLLVLWAEMERPLTVTFLNNSFLSWFRVWTPGIIFGCLVIFCDPVDTHPNPWIQIHAGVSLYPWKELELAILASTVFLLCFGTPPCIRAWHLRGTRLLLTEYIGILEFSRWELQSSYNQHTPSDCSCDVLRSMSVYSYTGIVLGPQDVVWACSDFFHLHCQERWMHSTVHPDPGQAVNLTLLALVCCFPMTDWKDNKTDCAGRCLALTSLQAYLGRNTSIQHQCRCYNTGMIFERFSFWTKGNSLCKVPLGSSISVVWHGRLAGRFGGRKDHQHLHSWLHALCLNQEKQQINVPRWMINPSVIPFQTRRVPCPH